MSLYSSRENGWNYFVVLSRLSHGSVQSHSLTLDISVGNKTVCCGQHVARDQHVEWVWCIH
jgi:hypothetical protein